MSSHRHYTFFDKLCLGLDQAVRALMGTVKTTGGDYPGKNIEDSNLSDEQRRLFEDFARTIGYTG